MSKIRVALLRGGPSSEYEVSLNSAKAMMANLALDKYDVVDVHITRDNHWQVGNEAVYDSAEAALDALNDIDVMLLALHGTFGEDGSLQALLQDRNIPFTGSSSEASRLAISKQASNLAYEKAGLVVPKWQVFTNDLPDVSGRVRSAFDLPLVVKPDLEGSSVGVSVVKQPDQLPGALKLAFSLGDEVMVQEFVDGREVSCGVLEVPGDGQPIVLPPTELIPNNAEFFDYDAKYLVGGAREITPPEMLPDVITGIQDIALQAHRLLGCSGYSRTDMFVRGDQILVIETNTLPGMTETSILPQQAAVAGITFNELLDGLIACALQR